MKVASDKSNAFHSIDIAETLREFEEQYRTVYWTIIEGDLYVYKPIGRRDYREICESDLSNEDKKDQMINKCILYPEDFDIDDCVAGVINTLFSKVIDVSYLDSIESKNGVTEYYRQDMYKMDNQITCIINEAFPNFDIEEIENWDIERTAKYLSRAEYKLQNFRGFQFNEEYFETNQEFSEEEHEEVNKPVPVKDEPTNEPQKEKLTQEKLRQLQAQFPEIDWANDAALSGGVDALAGGAVDTVAPALRPGMF